MSDTAQPVKPTETQRVQGNRDSVQQNPTLPSGESDEPPLQSPIAAIPATPVPLFPAPGTRGQAYIKPNLPAPNSPGGEAYPESNQPAPKIV